MLMTIRSLAAIFAAFLLSFNIARAEQVFSVDTVLGEWTDSSRGGRVVPYKLYIPHAAPGSRPVVIFSHGLGGSRDGAVYLLEYLAAHGYVAVAVQHRGSDTPAVMSEGGFGNGDPEALKQRLKQSISPAVTIDRFRDIPFAITSLTMMNTSDQALRGKLDLDHIGMSGHSFGAITTMALVGQAFGGGRMSFSDQRIKAAIAYSPSKPRREGSDAFAGIHIPTFHMTGTEDKNPLDASEAPSDRQIPYRSITAADKFLLVFNGGDHMVFSGRDFRGLPRPNDAKFHALVQKASLAYWDAYLLNNNDAKVYLTNGGFARDLAAEGTFEFQLTK